MHMIHQHRHLKLLKRARCGNIENGVGLTQWGDLCIACPACLIPGINPPDDWDKVDPSLRYVLSCVDSYIEHSHFIRFLYVLIIALDANFYLKNWLQSSEAADPSLHTSLAYFVKNEPYIEHIKKYATQTDVCFTMDSLIDGVHLTWPADEHV
jgi:hypothetical protein